MHERPHRPHRDALAVLDCVDLRTLDQRDFDELAVARYMDASIGAVLWLERGDDPEQCVEVYPRQPDGSFGGEMAGAPGSSWDLGDDSVRPGLSRWSGFLVGRSDRLLASGVRGTSATVRIGSVDVPLAVDDRDSRSGAFLIRLPADAEPFGPG
jgi:hypothetical protein